jgi:hypothetical protein
MKWQHLFWIVPLIFIVAFTLGFASKIYINIPEHVTLEMGYTPETIEVLRNCNLTLPESESVNVTVRSANDRLKSAMITK